MSKPQAPSAHKSESRQRGSPIDWVALFCTLGLIAFICFGQSVMKRFWYDELVCLGTGHFQTYGRIFHFFESGKDTTSFLPSMLVHLFEAIPGKPEIIFRMPFTLAYLGTCLCIWRMMRRRYGAGYASATVLFSPGGGPLLRERGTRVRVRASRNEHRRTLLSDGKPGRPLAKA